MLHKLYVHNKHYCITGNQLKKLMLGYIISALIIFLIYKSMFRDIILKLNKIN